MMKKILKSIIYIFVFFLFFIIFLPKESFYNLLEKTLIKNQIVISNETKEEKAFSLIISNGDIFYQGLSGAKIDEIVFKTYLFYTNVSLRNISVLDSLSSFIPTSIDNIILEHSILNFSKIKIEANGVFGDLIGDINLFSREIRIELSASTKMKSSYSEVLKNMRFENERYFYEYKF